MHQGDALRALAFHAGFEAWLARRLRGPQGGALRRLQLAYCTHDGPGFTQHQRRIFAALGQCPQLTELQARCCDLLTGLLTL